MIADGHRLAVQALADIKTAVEEFNRGERNLFDALEQVRLALSLLAPDEQAETTAA